MVFIIYKINFIHYYPLLLTQSKLLIYIVPFMITCQSHYTVYELLFWVFLNENEELTYDSHIKCYCMTHRSADV